MNVNKNSQVQKKIDTLLVINSWMTTAVKLMQDQFKKKKKKKTKKVSVSNSSSSFLALSATIQNSLLQFQSLNTHMTTGTVDTVDLTDYDFCASFITNNDSDFHVINCFYWDCLMNICSANDVKVCHDSDVTSVKLIGDVYYNVYDQYNCLIWFDIKEVLYVPDFIINIILMRLAKQWANLFFETQFECVYDANDYIHATT